MGEGAHSLQRCEGVELVRRAFGERRMVERKEKRKKRKREKGMAR